MGTGVLADILEFVHSFGIGNNDHHERGRIAGQTPSVSLVIANE